MRKVSAVVMLGFFFLMVGAVIIASTKVPKTNASKTSSSSKSYLEEASVPGAWSVICAPSLSDDKGAASVYSVTSVKGDRVTKVAIRSRSNQPIIAVKLGWRLFYYNSPEKTLLSGESPLLGVALKEGDRRDIEFPVVSFAKISKPFMQNGQINGDYKIEIRVTNIVFEDSEEKTSMISKSGFSLETISKLQITAF